MVPLLSEAMEQETTPLLHLVSQVAATFPESEVNPLIHIVHAPLFSEYPV